MVSLGYAFAFDFLNDQNSESVELRRQTETYGENGEETISESKIADVTMSIQPIADTDLIHLPEGDRERVVFKIYTQYSGLLTDDIIVRDSERFQIKNPPMKWKFSSQLHHYKSFLYKFENE